MRSPVTIVAVLAVVAVAAPAAVLAVDVAEGGIWAGQIGEYIRIDRQQSWQAAEDYCQATYGGHLASINSMDDGVRATSLYSLGSTNDHLVAWIGLNDIETEGTEGWADCTDLSFTHWRVGGPANSDDVDCVAMQWLNSRDGAYTWSRYDCDSMSYPFGQHVDGVHSICERGTIGVASCPDGDTDGDGTLDGDDCWPTRPEGAVVGDVTFVSSLGKWATTVCDGTCEIIFTQTDEVGVVTTYYEVENPNGDFLCATP